MDKPILPRRLYIPGVVVNFRISEKMSTRIDELSKKHHITKSSIGRAALDYYLEHVEEA